MIKNNITYICPLCESTQLIWLDHVRCKCLNCHHPFTIEDVIMMPEITEEDLSDEI